MKLKFQPGATGGGVTAPPSKSYSHRALILAALADGESALRHILVSDDTRHTLKVLSTLGVKHRLYGDTLRVSGSGGSFKVADGESTIAVGNSGSTVRLAGPLAALSDGKITFDGDTALRRRPVRDLTDGLDALGIEAHSINGDGCPPLTVGGGLLRGGHVSVSGETSSQHISGLLLVAPYAADDVTISVRGELHSRPYVKITIDAMRAFGGEVTCTDGNRFTVTAGKTYAGRDYTVEGDFSGAAFCLALGASGGRPVTVRGLNSGSCQGDRHFADILRSMGADVNITTDAVTVSRRQPLQGISIDMGDYPDVVQPLAVVAAVARGRTQISNIGHLIYKETDRINHTAAELRKMGIEVAVTADSLTISGGQPRGASVEAHHDHRMAMSLAVLAICATGETLLSGAEAVSKSYPDFFDDLKALGAVFEVCP